MGKVGRPKKHEGDTVSVSARIPAILKARMDADLAEGQSLADWLIGAIRSRLDDPSPFGVPVSQERMQEMLERSAKDWVKQAEAWADGYSGGRSERSAILDEASAQIAEANARSMGITTTIDPQYVHEHQGVNVMEFDPPIIPAKSWRSLISEDGVEFREALEERGVKWPKEATKQGWSMDRRIKWLDEKHPL